MRSGSSAQGVRYAVRRSGRAVAFCSLTIGCGTRDEAGYPAGIAHFTEHTLFRGTQRKSATVIGSYLDKLGGELNAYTTKEEIVLHATVLKEDLWKAVKLLFELATEATFPDSEIETERGVVLDEIISYKDNPSEDVYDRFEGLLFEGHPLGTPILGTTAEIPTVDGRVKIKIDPGTQSGKILRLRGQGIPEINGYGRGDLLVNIQVWTPQSVTRDEAKIIEKLKVF